MLSARDDPHANGGIADGRAHRALLIATLITASNAAGAAVEFTPRIFSGLSWTDNIERAASVGDEQADYVLELAPGFNLEQTSARMNSYVDYTMQNLFFAEDSDRNSTFHQLDANTTIEALQDLFFVDAAALYVQQLVEPTLPSNANNLFVTANMTDAFTARVTPRLQRQFGRTAASASYTRGRVDYLNTDAQRVEIEDVDDAAAALFLGSADEDERFTWALNYDHQKVEYDVSPDFQFDSLTAGIGWALNRPLRLLLRGGIESDVNEDQTGGGLDESFWKAGFRWSPDQRNEFEFLVGERFFGDTYEASWRREGRVLRIDARYTEEPTTEAQQLALRPVGTELEREPLPNSSDFARLTPEVFLRKELEGTVTLVGRRTEISLGFFEARREYVASGDRERARGGSVAIIRQMSSRNTATLFASLQRFTVREGGEYDDVLYSLTIARTLTPTTNATLQLAHTDRDGDVGDYRVNWVTLRFEKEF